MINWIRKEYKRFCNSKTVKLAYAAKATAIIGATMELLPTFEGMINPVLYPIIIGLLGFAGKQIRLATNTKLD